MKSRLTNVETHPPPLGASCFHSLHWSDAGFARHICRAGPSRTATFPANARRYERQRSAGGGGAQLLKERGQYESLQQALETARYRNGNQSGNSATSAGVATKLIGRHCRQRWHGDRRANRCWSRKSRAARRPASPSRASPIRRAQSRQSSRLPARQRPAPSASRYRMAVLPAQAICKSTCTRTLRHSSGMARPRECRRAAC